MSTACAARATSTSPARFSIRDTVGSRAPSTRNGCTRCITLPTVLVPCRTSSSTSCSRSWIAIMISNALLSDAWRGTLAEVDDHIFWLRRHLADDSKYAIYMREYRKPRYLDAVRRLTRYEEEMQKRGMRFIRGPIYEESKPMELSK